MGARLLVAVGLTVAFGLLPATGVAASGHNAQAHAGQIARAATGRAERLQDSRSEGSQSIQPVVSAGRSGGSWEGLMAAGGLSLPLREAEVFNPASQSHPGACSRTTESVGEALSDFRTNGVMRQFATLIGVHGHGSLSKAMARSLVVGVIGKRVMTENHGCDGEGHWFPVGPRVLPKGQRVGIKVPAKLRKRACSKPSRKCKRVRLNAYTVFPINCWNPNMGRVEAYIYLRKPKHHTGHFKQKHEPEHKFHPRPTPVEPQPTQPTPAATPSAKPAATAALKCEVDGVVVTLSDAATATASASFVVDEIVHGPVAPGEGEQVTIPLAPGATTTITVTSGAESLIDEEQFVNTCDPVAAVIGVECPEFEGAEVEPAPEISGIGVSTGSSGSAESARRSLAGSKAGYEAPAQQQPGEPDMVVEILLVNRPSAVAPVMFEVEWKAGEEYEVTEYGPLAPGGEETVEALIPFSAFFQGQPTVIVRSGGRVILEKALGEGCFPEVG